MGIDSVEELVHIRILSHSERYFRMGKNLSVKDRVKILLSLVQNWAVFAWNSYEVPRVDSAFIMHRLNVDPLVPPKKKRPKRVTKPHVEAMKEEVEKLKRVGATKEMFFPKWLANMVVVKKENGKWRVCVDFTELNRVCPKELFLVPKIDQLVDAIVGH